MSLEVGKRVARWSIILTGIDYIVLVVLLLFSLLVTSALGPANYGIFAVSSVTYILLLTVVTNIILEPSVKLIAGYYGKRDYDNLSKTLGAIIVYLTLLTIGITIIYVLLTPVIAVYVYNRPYLIEYMMLLVPTVVLTNYIGLFKRILIAFGNYSLVAVGRIIDGITYVIGILIVIFLQGWTVRAVVLGVNLYTILYFVLMIPLVQITHKKRNITVKLTLNKAIFAEILDMGKYFVTSNTLNTVFNRLDITILPIFVPNVYVGYYSFVKNMVSRTKFLFYRLRGLLYPTFSENLERYGLQFIKRLLERALTFAIYYTVPISFLIMMFPKQIIETVSFLLIDINMYLEAYPILAILSLTLIIDGTTSVLVPYFLGTGKLRVFVNANIVGFIASIVFIPVLIIFFGIEGAAVGYTLTTMASLLYYLSSTAKEIKVPVKRIIKRILVGILVALFVSQSYNFLILMGIVSGTISTILDVVYLVAFGIAYVFLDFVAVSIFRVLTINEIEVIQKIAGSNKITSSIALLIKRVYLILSRTQKQK